MDCRSFEWQVQSHLDGKLSMPEQQDLLKHAESCASCAALLQDMEALNALLSEELTLVDPPAGFVDGVMASLPTAGQGTLVQLQPQKRKTWLRNGGLVAAAALLLAVGATQLWPSVEPIDPNLPANQPGQVAQVDPRDPVDPDPDPLGLVIPDPNDPIDPDPELPGDVDPEGSEEPDPLDVDDPEQSENDPPQQPAVIAEVPPVPQTQSGSLDFPAPAYASPQQVGQLLVTLLAAHDDCNAVLPTVNAEGQVVYYTYYNGKYYEWTQSLDVEASAEYVSEADSVPSLLSITRSDDSSSFTGYSTLTALSPDKRWQVTNRGGNEPGTYLISRVATLGEDTILPLLPERDEYGDAEPIRIGEGGGRILTWSSDSNKVLYTDAADNLYAYYIAEAQPVLVFEGAVSSACWLGNNRTVLLSGTPAGSSYSNIYTVTMP